VARQLEDRETVNKLVLAGVVLVQELEKGLPALDRRPLFTKDKAGNVVGREGEKIVGAP
jgi:hypothetical protein